MLVRMGLQRFRERLVNVIAVDARAETFSSARSTRARRLAGFRSEVARAGVRRAGRGCRIARDFLSSLLNSIRDRLTAASDALAFLDQSL